MSLVFVFGTTTGSGFRQEGGGDSVESNTNRGVKYNGSFVDLYYTDRSLCCASLKRHRGLSAQGLDYYGRSVFLRRFKCIIDYKYVEPKKFS